MHQPNLYRVLHVQGDAPVEIIRTSYRTLMRALAQHPDLGGDTAAAALINEAFETLNDPVRRAAYDRTLASAEALERESPPEAPTTQPHVFTAAERACLFCGEPHVDRQSRMPDAHCACCDSPLCSAPTAARSSDSRRGFHRMPLVLHVSCEMKGSRAPFEGVTQNLSVAGLRLLSSSEVAVDQIVRLDCEFCSAVGVVRYAHEASGRSRRWWEVGIEFKTLHVKQTRGSLVSVSA
jgi:curved DNA-binding protein CbpA